VRARLYSAHQNKDEHHDQDRFEGAGREMARAGAMGDCELSLVLKWSRATAAKAPSLG